MQIQNSVAPVAVPAKNSAAAPVAESENSASGSAFAEGDAVTLSAHAQGTLEKEIQLNLTRLFMEALFGRRLERQASARDLVAEPEPAEVADFEKALEQAGGASGGARIDAMA